ncbi:DUF4097 family beta strand repeat-containing protein [Tellurirhabdus bombi]|uniref:DUF4097 family beta strand repeat-containing protein n=1 Tax=Tellurirhabdus bombi TaxID=2907205 RepID=UPI001F43063D|nr:DUF4097 family beta strand repeat-containing protein [Tellurirhabdus bombi]
MKFLQNTFLATAVFAASGAFAQSSNEQPYKTQNFSGNYNNVRVQTSGGSITVEGSQNSGAKVEMYVRANNGNDRLSQSELEDRLRDYDISITTEGNTVVATAKRHQNNQDWKRSVSIAFKVFVPRTIATDLKTSGGSIRISHLNGQQNFQTSGGSLHLVDIEGTVRGRTSGGSIHLDDCRKDIELTTSGGSIHAKNSSGDLRLKTSGGSIHLQDLKGMIQARTSGGSVNVDGADGELMASTSGGSIRLRDITGSIRAETSAGGIDADIRKLGEFLRLSTSAGSVRVNLPMDKGMDIELRGNRVATGALRSFDGTMEKDHVRGRLNGGGVPVQISAGSGNVYVNQ